MAALRSFLAGLGAMLDLLARILDEYRRRKALARAQADADRINACPADEWMRRFGGDRADASPPEARKSDPDA